MRRGIMVGMRDQDTIRAASYVLLSLGVLMLVLTLAGSHAFVYAIAACIAMIGMGAVLHFSIKE